MMAFVISTVSECIAQVNEIVFSFDYSLAPIGNDGIDINKTSFGVSIPVKIKKGEIINTLKVGLHELDYADNYQFSTTNLSEFKDFSYTLKYIYPLFDTWNLNAEAQASLVSNSLKSITDDDFFIGGEVSIVKLLNPENTSETFSFGVMYTTITGEPRFLPTMYYINQVNDKFLYRIGFPKTSATYKLNDLSVFKSSLSMDGDYFNLSPPVSMSTVIEANKASFSSTSLALEYHYKMDDHWSILFKGGYSFNNKYKLFDTANTMVFDFDTTPKPIFSAGIKFNISK